MRTINQRIADHAFFASLPPEKVAVVVRGATERVFQAGEIIFREGEPANRFYLIEHGGVALEAHEPAGGTFPIQSLLAGDVLGWSWFLPPFVWHLQARALETTSVLVLDAARLLVAAEEDHAFGYRLMKRVVQVLLARLKATRGQLTASQSKLLSLEGRDAAAVTLEGTPEPTGGTETIRRRE
jgi:CRP/FNR family transcriptional regulator, cyclic AMP receptor protein